jgi:glyoxylase-like metal-dependent hydrolase (beta-lactamase superfamily II)
VPDVRAAIIPVTPLQQNCTLLWCEATKKAAVIDPGGDLDRIRQAIAESGASVEKIILTHGHIDHAGGAAELRDALGVPVEGPHEADRFLLDRLEEAGRAYGIPARPVAPDRWLDEGDTVSVGALSLHVLHCPGHSPGSVVLVSPEQRFAIVGDVLFQGSVGRTDLPAATAGPSSARSGKSFCRSATTSPSSAATAPPAPSARNGGPIPSCRARA